MVVLFGLWLISTVSGPAWANAPRGSMPCSDELGIPIAETFRAEVRRINVPSEKNAVHAVILAVGSPGENGGPREVIFKGVSINSLVRAKTMRIDLDYRELRREWLPSTELEPVTRRGQIDVYVTKLPVSTPQVKTIRNLPEGAMLKINGSYYRLQHTETFRRGPCLVLGSFGGKPRPGDPIQNLNARLTLGPRSMSLSGEDVETIVFLGPSRATADRPPKLSAWPNADERVRIPLDRFKFEIENFRGSSPAGAATP